MINRDTLISFLNSSLGKEFLRSSMEKDELANGVQILGGEEVERVTLGVSANQDFLNEAVRVGSNFCIFHHGLDTTTYRSRYPDHSQQRLRTIFKHELTIVGYHYALDAHPEIGNNATIIKKLGAARQDPLFEDYGYTATFIRPQEVQELSRTCSKIFEHDVFAVFTGLRDISTIGVVSGAAKPYAEHILEMKAKGVQLFITGEASESVPNKMKEAGINYFACGHYATEVFGVQELGKLIKSHFQDRLEVEFIDIPNPI